MSLKLSQSVENLAKWKEVVFYKISFPEYQNKILEEIFL
jgi:hypothetical protein